MKNKLTIAKSVADYARELPLCDTEIERFMAMYKASDRLRLTLNQLLCNTGKVNAINPWWKETITDAMNELVAHLEIAGALKESLEFACLNHKKKQEQLIAFIREIAESDCAIGIRARIKLKKWNL